MQCPSCGFDNTDEMRFCGQCATSLSPCCPQCGFQNPSGFNFCGQCATPLAEQTSSTGPTPPAQQLADSERRFQALLRAVMWQLQCDSRVTYRTLKYVFGIDEALIEGIREELAFRRLATDEDGKGLIWTGEAQPVTPSRVAVPNQATSEDTTVNVPTLSPPVTETSTPSNGPTATPEAISIEARQDETAVTPEPVHIAPEAERRQLTVMFCDLADSTKLSQQLDPEDLREVIRSYQATAAEVIRQYDGHIAQYLGDGLLVYFGWPAAHEDDAQRALHVGLGIVEAITTALNPSLSLEKGVQLTVRIGIHTGSVVVGEMGGGGRHENLATGETVNIAARLEGLAQPNTVLISQVAARLVRDAFLLEELGVQRLKGVAEPIPVYRVLSPLEVDGDEDATTPVHVSLVGRDEEVGLLIRRWEQIKEGLGQVILISGEAGIGKSSLVETLRTQVRHEGYPRIVFRCSPYHLNSALYAVIQHVQRFLDLQPDDVPGVKLDKLERGLRTYRFVSEAVIPLFANLLSLPLPEGRYPPLRLAPAQQRQQTQDAVVAWMLEEAERQPLLAVWEDLHWADPSTLELLGILVEQTPTVPMLHVLTARPEFVPPWPNRSHITPITLNRLERPQVEALITRLANGKTLPPEVVEHIVAKTDGVPLFIEELTKMLLESELLHEQGVRYTLTGPLSAVSIPVTLYDSLMARLDRLPAVREVAQLGSVLGREFAYEMLRALIEVDETTLRDRLSQLVDTELLYQRGRPPHATYIFKHALVQDAAYASLLKSKRQRVHLQVAQMLEDRFPETVAAEPELVAHHYSEAGAHEQAVAYWQRAGQRYAERSQHQEAIAYLRSGLAELALLPETTPHLEQELTLQVALGSSLYTVLGYGAPEVEPIYQRARELCQQVGDTSQIFRVLRGLCVFYMGRAETKTMQEMAEEILSQAKQQTDEAPHMLGHYLLGLALLLQGQFNDADGHLEQALTIYDPQVHRDLAYVYGIDIGVAARAFAGVNRWILGYPDQALRYCQDSLLLGQTQNHPFSLVFAHVIGLAWLHHFRRDAISCHERTAEGGVLAAEQGFAVYVAWSMVLKGWASTVQGQPIDGVAALREGLKMATTTDSKLFHSNFLALLANALRDTGQIEEGLALLTEAHDQVEQTGEAFYAAELYRLAAEFRQDPSPQAQAESETNLQQALSIARQQQAKSWELRAATSLARLWQSQGKRQEAHDLLAPVYNWFTEGFDTADLQEAKGLLKSLALL
jgi:class 3 adenylate cyclase/predicted ATPase